MSTTSLIVGFVIGTVGFSFFIYGKKQRRPPQLVVGIIQMVAPMIVREPLLMSATAVLSIVALRFAIARGL